MTSTADRTAEHPDPMDEILDSRLVGIIRTATPEQAFQDGLRLMELGVTCVEVSLVTPDATDVIRQLDARRAPGVVLGAGTVLTPGQVRDVRDAGATYALSPVLDLEVVAAAGEAGLRFIPGCATPSEMHTAMRAGAAAVKLFPASQWAPSVLTDVLTAQPDLPVIPAGGVGLDTAPHWYTAGAVAVGVGSALIQPGVTAAGIRGLRRPA